MTDRRTEHNYWEKAGEVRAIHPHGNSLKCATHFIQCYNRPGQDDYFCKFDYGEKENLIRYGQKTPPVYDLTKIKTKMRIYYGTHDKYFTEACIKKLASKLHNAQIEMQKMDGWGHVTFSYGRNMRQFYTDIYNRHIKA